MPPALISHEDARAALRADLAQALHLAAVIHLCRRARVAAAASESTEAPAQRRAAALGPMGRNQLSPLPTVAPAKLWLSVQGLPHAPSQSPP